MQPNKKQDQGMGSWLLLAPTPLQTLSQRPLLSRLCSQSISQAAALLLTSVGMGTLLWCLSQRRKVAGGLRDAGFQFLTSYWEKAEQG